MGTTVVKMAEELLTMDKRRARIIIGLLTGYVALRTHLFKLGLAEQENCRLCRELKEDSIHILCNCPVLVCRRYNACGRMFIGSEDLNKVKLSSLLCLVRKTE